MNEKAKPIKVKATINAWTHDDYSMERFMRGLEDGDHEKSVNALSFSILDMSTHGYVRVGTAEIEVELLPMDQIQHQQLHTLTAQLEKERAESQAKQNIILDKISKITAIGYTRPDPMTDIDADCPF